MGRCGHLVDPNPEELTDQTGGASVAQRLILHIGTQKSGTTYLQRVLAALSPTLRKKGVLYPIRLVGKREVYNHEAAAYGLLGTEAFPWVPRHRAEAQRDSWQALVDKIARWDGTAVVSGEALSVICATDAQRLVESLGTPTTDVIITARDLGRVLPSSWQQHIRNGRSTPFSTYVRQLDARRGTGSRADRRARWEADPDHTFWRAYAIGSLAQRWSSFASSVRVIGVPRAGADSHELWRRFIDATDLSEIAPHSPPTVDMVAANIGITEPETLVLAGLNKAFENGELPEPRRRATRGRIVREAFVLREHRGRRVALPAEWTERVRTWAEEDVEELEQTGATLTGERSDLLVDELSTTTEAPDPEAVADAAGAAIALLADLIPAEPQPQQPEGRRRKRGSDRDT
jgi:hypothetical protein